MPLSRSQLKLIRSLQYAKFRARHGLFVAEGAKTIATVALRLRPSCVYATAAAAPGLGMLHPEIVGERDLHAASFLQHPQGCLALFPLPSPAPPPTVIDGLCLVLDGIQDPGNLGTILRTAHWMGIRHIVCSEDTADAFSPKAVQATMGSLAHVGIHRTDLPSWLDGLPDDTAVCATAMHGDNLFTAPLPHAAVVIMGNEGNGIRPEVLQRARHRLSIPCYAHRQGTAESLNVAIATAIVCAEHRRRHHPIIK